MGKVLLSLGLVISFALSAPAAIVLDDGLLLQGGEEQLILQAGDKVYLRVQNSIWKYPMLRGLEFSSQYPHIAYVDRYGWVHALSPGRTVISVWNEGGDNGTIEILVERGSKIGIGGILLVSVWILGLGAVILSKKVRCF